LQKKINNYFKGLFKPEARFMTYLTIARIKNVRQNSIQKLHRANQDKSGKTLSALSF